MSAAGPGTSGRLGALEPARCCMEITLSDNAPKATGLLLQKTRPFLGVSFSKGCKGPDPLPMHTGQAREGTMQISSPSPAGTLPQPLEPEGLASLP